MLNLSVYRPSPHLATRIKVLLDLSVEFRDMSTSGSGEAPSTPPSLPTTSNVEPKPLEVRGLPCFDPKGEPTTLSVRWKRWKRAFRLYVASKGVTNQAQKVALLLHSGGMELQEIFYTLAPEDEAQNNFDNCLTVLDNYFTPKVNVPFERHGFRQMAQLQGETVDQFVCRLRQKAVACEFDKVDEAIRDQLIEKCRDPALRRKFLEKAQDGTLTVLQDVARVHESVNLQMRSLETSNSCKNDQVNAVQAVDPKRKKNNTKNKKKRRRKMKSQGSIRGAIDAMKPVILPAVALPETKHATSVD